MISFVVVTSAFAITASAEGSPLQPKLIAGSEPALFWQRVGSSLGLAPGGGAARFAVTAAVLAALALTYLAVLAAAHRGLLGVKPLLALAVIANVVPIAMPLLYSRDAYSYVAYGRVLAVHHANPYVVVPSAFPDDPVLPYVGRQWRSTTPVYGPLFTTMTGATVGLAHEPRASVNAFRVIAIAASVATTFLVAFAARRVRPALAPFAVAAFGLNPVVVYQTVASGHNDVLVALGVAGAAALMVARRDLLAVGALTVATLIKITIAPALLVVVVISVARSARRRRALVLSAVVVVGLSLIAALPFMQTSDPTLGQAQLTKHEGWFGNGRIVRTLAEALDWPALDAVFRGLIVALLIALTIAMARRAWLRSRASDLEALGAIAWTLLVTILLIPALLPWYLVWLLPLAWALPRGGRSVAIGLSVLALTTLIAVDVALFPEEVRLNTRLVSAVVAPLVLAIAAVVIWGLIKRLRGEGGIDLASDPARVGREMVDQPTR